MAPRNWDLPKQVKTLTVNGYEMAYVEQGQGTPLVLVHGSLGDYRAWALQLASFSAEYRTIAVSLRHFYPEPWNGGGTDFSLHQHAHDLAAFIKTLGAGSVHLLGHSRGGDVALITASAHPRLLRSLVLADPAALDQILPGTATVRSETQNRKEIVTSALERLQQGEVDRGLEIFIDAVSQPGTWRNLPESAKQIRRDNAWSLKGLVADAQAPFTRAEAQKIEAPTLLVSGAKSPPLYGMMHDALQQCLGHQQKVSIKNASHGMNREKPEPFNAAVLAFLGRHTDPAHIKKAR